MHCNAPVLASTAELLKRLQKLRIALKQVADVFLYECGITSARVTCSHAQIVADSPDKEWRTTIYVRFVSPSVPELYAVACMTWSTIHCPFALPTRSPGVASLQQWSSWVALFKCQAVSACSMNPGPKPMSSTDRCYSASHLHMAQNRRLPKYCALRDRRQASALISVQDKKLAAHQDEQVTAKLAYAACVRACLFPMASNALAGRAHTCTRAGSLWRSCVALVGESRWVGCA